MTNNEAVEEPYAVEDSEPYTFEDWAQFKDWEEEENFGPDPELFPEEAKAFQVDWSIKKFEEGAEGFHVFRIVTEVNDLAFYSEDLTREYIIEMISDDPFWILSFDGVVSLQAQEAEGDWIQV